MKYSIKPLEWRCVCKGHWQALTPFGEFNAVRWQNGEWQWSGKIAGYYYSTTAPKLKAAKVAAQAHWEERLKQALKEEK